MSPAVFSGGVQNQALVRLLLRNLTKETNCKVRGRCDMSLRECSSFDFEGCEQGLKECGKEAGNNNITVDHIGATIVCSSIPY